MACYRVARDFLRAFAKLRKATINLVTYYVEIKCQLDATDEFLLQILLLAQHAAARKPDTQPSTPHCTDNLKTKHQIRQTATTCIIL
jgi:hypothetical protein